MVSKTLTVISEILASHFDALCKSLFALTDPYTWVVELEHIVSVIANDEVEMRV
jgi:hypothetical protein